MRAVSKKEKKQNQVNVTKQGDILGLDIIWITIDIISNKELQTTIIVFHLFLSSNNIINIYLLLDSNQRKHSVIL